MYFICHGGRRSLSALNKGLWLRSGCAGSLTVAEGSWLSVISWRSPRGLTLRKRRLECCWDPSLCRAPSSLSLVFSTCKEAAADISASWLNIQFFQIPESLWRRRRFILDHIYKLRDEKSERGSLRERGVGLDRWRQRANSTATGGPQFPVGSRKYTNILSKQKEQDSGFSIRTSCAETCICVLLSSK